MTPPPPSEFFRKFIRFLGPPVPKEEQFQQEMLSTVADYFNRIEPCNKWWGWACAINCQFKKGNLKYNCKVLNRHSANYRDWGLFQRSETNKYGFSLFSNIFGEFTLFAVSEEWTSLKNDQATANAVSEAARVGIELTGQLKTTERAFLKPFPQIAFNCCTLLLAECIPWRSRRLCNQHGDNLSFLQSCFYRAAQISSICFGWSDGWLVNFSIEHMASCLDQFIWSEW